LDGKLVKINFEDVKSHNLLVAGLPGTGKTSIITLIWYITAVYYLNMAYKSLKWLL